MAVIVVPLEARKRDVLAARERANHERVELFDNLGPVVEPVAIETQAFRVRARTSSQNGTAAVSMLRGSEASPMRNANENPRTAEAVCATAR